MAPPPLLPFTRLAACSACSEHVKVGDPSCPHCGAAVVVSGGVGRALITAAAMAGMLGSCSAEPEYGVSATSDTTMATEEPSDTETTGTQSASSTGAPTTGGTETGTGEETGTSDDTSTSGDTGTTTAEPEYGVPSTTAGESDYGMPAL